MDDVHDGGADGARHDGHAASARGGAGLCPLCLAREVGRSVGPEVVGHLVAAGRELALAVGAALDAHAAAHDATAARAAGPADAGAEDGADDGAQDGADAGPGARGEDAGADRSAEVRRLRRIPVE